MEGVSIEHTTLNEFIYLLKYVFSVIPFFFFLSILYDEVGYPKTDIRQV